MITTCSRNRSPTISYQPAAPNQNSHNPLTPPLSPMTTSKFFPTTGTKTLPITKRKREAPLDQNNTQRRNNWTPPQQSLGTGTAACRLQNTLTSVVNVAGVWRASFESYWVPLNLSLQNTPCSTEPRTFSCCWPLDCLSSSCSMHLLSLGGI